MLQWIDFAHFERQRGLEKTQKSLVLTTFGGRADTWWAFSNSIRQPDKLGYYKHVWTRDQRPSRARIPDTINTWENVSGGSATNMATGTEQFVREIECCGRVLRLYQDFVGDVGCVVWDAALVLGRFLENKTFFPSDYWSSNKRVLELGAGTGAVGLIAALLGWGRGLKL